MENRGRYAQLKAKRAAADRAARAQRHKAELARLRAPWKDLGSPLGFGPVWEAMSPQRHITPDPDDQSKPPGMPGNGNDRGGW